MNIPYTDISWSAQTWTAIASGIAAWIALAISIFNLRTSRRALRISEAQELRRKPSIASYLQDSYVAVGAKPNARVYAVLISLSNRSDNNNGIAIAALHLTYVKRSSTEFTVKVGLVNDPPDAFSDKSASYLQLPLRIDAHQTVSGWAFFAVDDAILEDAFIKSTCFSFTDTYGNESIVEPLNVREYNNAMEARPAENDLPNAEGPAGPHSS